MLGDEEEAARLGDAALRRAKSRVLAGRRGAGAQAGMGESGQNRTGSASSDGISA